MDIINSVVVITGAASGLGRATAEYIIKNGGKVSIFDLDDERGGQLIGEYGSKIIYNKVDITDERQVDAAVKNTLKELGHINILVNCAGVGVPFKVFSKNGVMDMAKWYKTIDINLNGTMQTIRFSVNEMIKNKPDINGEKGVIINTASIAAFEGQVGQSAYASSKAGVVGMTLPLAREFSSIGIRVMTIAPGLFLTPMLLALSDEVQESLGKSVPFPNRLGKPEEYAALVGHIIKNPMLNGETIRIDGALRMAPR